MRSFAPQSTSRKFRGFLAILALAASVFLVNLLQMLSLVAWPFSAQLFRALNRNLAAFWWNFAVWCTEKLCGMEIKITGDALPTAENALVIANHQQMADILVILSLAYRHARIGDLKWFAKNPLKYIPGIGWGMLFIDCIFLKRNWMNDKNSVLATFAKFRSQKIPFWLVSFLEGTRATKEKIEASQKYSRENQLPILNHVLIPRSKGFIATVQGLENDFAAVYDLTIGFENFVPTLSQFFMRPIARVHLHVKRYPRSSLPQDPKALADWTLARFQEKDQRMKEFFAHGHF